MSGLWIVWAILALLFAMDIVRIRRRARALPVLAPSDEPVSPDRRFLVAPGVRLSPEVRKAASAHARSEGLAVLDLVPADLSAGAAWNLLQLVEPQGYRDNRLAPGRTAAHAVLVTQDVWERARLAPPGDLADFVRMAARLKRYASTATDLAVAPGLPAMAIDPYRRRAVLREAIGGMERVILIGQPLIVAVLVAGVVVAPWAGAAALLAFHLQGPLALLGGPLRAPGKGRLALLRVVLELASWIGMVAEPLPDRREARDARRDLYERLMSGDLDRFLLPPEESCPLCEGGLTEHLTNRDLFQHKPGRFRLDRCVECGHIFQNPRLSIEGLEFYYKDFYDGLGEEELEGVFAWAGEPYVARARMVAELGEPKTWLDVGCGHGHFCLVARDVLPGARFDGLDLSESVEEAERRGWIDRAYRGLFPELAEVIAGRYDVVSMSHYLEHTIDPESEIAAARTALSEEGTLLIELPDPECPFGRWLGRLWLPWFQPQHLHLLSVRNLERILRRQGFEPQVWHRAEAHQRVDLMFATYLFLNRLAPPIDVPWRPRPTWLGRLWHGMVWGLGAGWMLAARLVDRGIGPVVKRLGASNTYRVVARKVGLLTSAGSPAALRAATPPAEQSVRLRRSAPLG